jgi:hypothetical protein
LPPFSVRRWSDPLLDGGLIVGVLAGAALVLAANHERPAAPWPPGAVALSRAAVARDPLDAAALRDLGLAFDLSGDAADADQLMSLAGERTRRDTPTAAWLLVQRLSRARYRDAFAAADALLRRDVDEQTRERLFALLVSAAHYDASRLALTVRLAEVPWWRLAFMRELAARAEPDDTRLVLAGLATTADPPTAAELDVYLTRLLEAKAYGAAARDWTAFSRPRRDPDAIGDLTAPPPFGWSPVFGEGASSMIEDGALRVDYDGYGAAKLPVRLIALPPGRYAVMWRERVSGDDVRAIGVTVLCREAGAVLASAAPLASGPAIREQRLDFEVPATGCEGQMLAITPLPRDRRATVTAWFKRWSLARR